MKDGHDVEMAHWLDALRRRSRLFAAVLGGTVVLGLLLAVVQSPEYEATAEVQVAQSEGAALLGNSSPDIDLESELRTARSAEVADRAEDVPDAGDVTVTADDMSGVLNFTATGSAPEAAATAANNRAEAFIEVRRERAEAETRDSISKLEERADRLERDIRGITATDSASLERAAALRTQRATYRQAADRLEVSLLVGGATEGRLVAEAEQPDERSSLQLLGYLAFAVLAGLFLGAGAVGVAEFLDRSVKDPDTASDAVGAPVLARLATVPGEVTGSGVVVVDDPVAAEAERYRRLRTTVRSLVDTARPIIQVTSTRDDDGAGVVAVNLAAAFAQSGVETVLVCLAEPAGVALDTRPTKGIAAVVSLVGDGAPAGSRLAQLAGLQALTVVVRPEVGSRDALVHGPVVDSLKQLTSVAETVVVLTPPALASSTALELADLVDGTVVVARERVTPTAALQETGRALALMESGLVGVVLA